MRFRKKTVRDVDVSGQVVLVRVDYNVPIKDGEVADDMRIRASFPTLQYLRQQGAAKIVLISHLGRPEGQPNPEFSLAPVAKKLAELLPDKDVRFCNATVGEAARYAANLKKDGKIIVNSQMIDPMPVITGAAEYPENVLEELKSKGVFVDEIDALSLATEAGNAKSVNIVLMGRLAKHFHIEKEKWIEAINNTVKLKSCCRRERIKRSNACKRRTHHEAV